MNKDLFLKCLEEMGIDRVFLPERFSWRSLLEEVRNCKKCGLHEMRKNVVFGEGPYDADIVFIGEAPGEEEDREGRPFVGKAGKLLTKIMEDAGLLRESVFICNVLKCRPPGNRDPEREEIEACRPYLIRQLELLKPKVIVTLGRYAYNSLFSTDERITKVRGEVKSFGASKVIPTYHPSFLLRNEAKIPEFSEDIKKALELSTHLS